MESAKRVARRVRFCEGKMKKRRAEREKPKKREKRGGTKIQKKFRLPPLLFFQLFFGSLFPHFTSQTLPKERESERERKKRL